MHHSQDRHMVVRAVDMAIWQRTGKNPVIFYIQTEAHNLPAVIIRHRLKAITWSAV